MKRFTETQKWSDPWFMDLSGTAKLLWFYLLDNCDNAGVIRFNPKLAAVQIGKLIEEKHFAELVGRVQPLDGGKLWIPAFIQFQYGTLRPECRPHLSVLDLVSKHGLKLRVSKPYVKGIHTLKDKEPDKDPEQGVKEFPSELRTARVLNKWQVWMTHRRAHKKPKSWLSLFNEQVEWLSKFSEPEVFEILSASIRNGWQGLFEPKKEIAVNGRALSPFDYKTIIQAKQTQADSIKNKFCSETAIDQVWASEPKRQEYITLRREIKDLTAKLGAYGT